VQVKSVAIGSSTFNLTVKQASRGDNKGKPFLAVDFGKTPDPQKVLAFVAAVGQQPVFVNLVRWLNREIGPATVEAFPVVNGQPAFDAAIAAQKIVAAIADSVSEGNDQIKEELEVVRAEQSKFYDDLLPLLQTGKMPSAADLNKLTQLKLKVTMLEAKLAKKARKPKTTEAAVPALAAK
jgi:hypothetical protein